MNIIMLYDQVQAGKGTKDDPMVPLGATKNAVGPAIMMERALKRIDAHVAACIYCGDGYFSSNTVEVSRKIVAMITKLHPGAVIAGPCFNYLGYGKMAAQLAYAIQTQTDVPVIAAMAEENSDTIREFAGKIPIVRTPRKGGTGLNEALDGMCQLVKAMHDDTDTSDLIATYCFT